MMIDKITITNSKIAGLEPDWAPYRGFSLLFDNPGESFHPDEKGQLCIKNQQDDRLKLYQALDAFIQQIQDSYQLENYWFCAVPYCSYHVTVWDGISAGRIAYLPNDKRSQLKLLLENLPILLGADNLFTRAAKESRLVSTEWNIEWKVKGLSKWSNTLLVALLEPQNPQSLVTYEAITHQRILLNQAYRQNFDILLRDSYHPHVTLGYFANLDLAKRASPFVDHWQRMLMETTRGLNLQFDSISLYAFKDMVTFLKSP